MKLGNKADSVGKRISKARKAAGLTQDQLANALFMSKSAICNYENGRREPSYRTLERIAETCSVSVSDLLVDVYEPTKTGHIDGQGKEFGSIERNEMIPPEWKLDSISYTEFMKSLDSLNEKGQEMALQMYLTVNKMLSEITTPSEQMANAVVEAATAATAFAASSPDPAHTETEKEPPSE